MKIEEAIKHIKKVREATKDASICCLDGEAIDCVVDHFRDDTKNVLTWQDIRRIVQIADDFINYTEPTTTEKEYYEQVLKEFQNGSTTD